MVLLSYKNLIFNYLKRLQITQILLNVIKVYTSNANAYKRRELTHKEDLKN